MNIKKVKELTMYTSNNNNTAHNPTHSPTCIINETNEIVECVK